MELVELVAQVDNLLQRAAFPPGSASLACSEGVAAGKGRWRQSSPVPANCYCIVVAAPNWPASHSMAVSTRTGAGCAGAIAPAMPTSPGPGTTSNS